MVNANQLQQRADKAMDGWRLWNSAIKSARLILPTFIDIGLYSFNSEHEWQKIVWHIRENNPDDADNFIRAEEQMKKLEGLLCEIEIRNTTKNKNNWLITRSVSHIAVQLSGVTAGLDIGSYEKMNILEPFIIGRELDKNDFELQPWEGVQTDLSWTNVTRIKALKQMY